MATILYQDGATIGSNEIDTPATSHLNFASCYLFAFPKAGSVLVNEIVRVVMREIGVPIVDLPQYAFDKGISLEAMVCDISKTFKDVGYCYSGFRALPS